MNGNSRIPRGPADSPAVAPSETLSSRAQLRRQLAARRAAIAPATRLQWDADIAAHLLAWQAREGHAALAVYQALRGEPDLAPAYAALAARGVRLALPVVVQRDAPLGFAEWQPGEALQRDAMGIAVPAAMRLIAAPPVLLVPCLGFDSAAYRLGYGGGYYDRTLAQSPRPATVGIAYACQQAVFDNFPHDIPLDAILTEAGFASA